MKGGGTSKHDAWLTGCTLTPLVKLHEVAGTCLCYSRVAIHDLPVHRPVASPFPPLSVWATHTFPVPYPLMKQTARL